MGSRSTASANNQQLRVVPRSDRRDLECFVLLAESSAPASPFWAKVSMPGLDGARCWQWTGDLTPRGACVGQFVDKPAEAKDRDRMLWIQPVHEWLSFVTIDVPLEPAAEEDTDLPDVPRRLQAGSSIDH